MEVCMKYFFEVKKCIDEWNPYGLLPDAPENEFDGESEMIAEEIYDGISIKKLAGVISEVFSMEFELDYFQEEQCMDIAESIYNEIFH